MCEHSEGSSPTGYGFTGERWEAYSELVFLRARYYQLGTGRFISKDPWGGSMMRPATLNGFSYVNNNPVRFVDLLGLCDNDPYDPYIDYDCWMLAKEVAKQMWLPVEIVGRQSQEYLTLLYASVSESSSIRDLLTPVQWQLAKEKATMFQIPVELVAGTIATEIRDDTSWHDPLLDDFLDMALRVHWNCPGTYPGTMRPKPGPDLCYSSFLRDDFLAGYENYWGILGGRGPGPGIANVHIGTAKATEKYFATFYPGQHFLDSPPDIYMRMDNLLRDEHNIHYTAALLKQLTDQRKGRGLKPSLGPHLHDLTDVDMQIIYGAGTTSYDQELIKYQEHQIPGYYGKQILPWLLFYREKLRIEGGP